MEGRNIEELPELLMSVWMGAFEQKRFHDALMEGFASYLVSREIKNEEAERTALVAIRGAVESLLPSNGQEQECSFCARRPPEVRLAAGPYAFICNSCVETLNDVFTGARR